MTLQSRQIRLITQSLDSLHHKLIFCITDTLVANTLLFGIPAKREDIS